MDNIDQPAPDSAKENTYVDVGYKDEVLMSQTGRGAIQNSGKEAKE